MISRRRFIRTALLAAGGLLAGCVRSPLAPPEPTPTLVQIPTAEPTRTKTPPKPTQTPKNEPRVLAKDLDFPEGPAFDRRGRLWCTEANAGNLVLVGDGIRRYSTGGRPNGLVFDYKDHGYVCDSHLNAIRRFDTNDPKLKLETVVDAINGAPLLTPNDLAFDPLGNLVFTCPNDASGEASGYVACLAPDGTVTIIAEDLNRPNGVDFIDQGKTLVVADTYQKTLYRGAWDAKTRTWGIPQPWMKVGGAEGPDGITPGKDGLLYIAIFGDGMLRVVDPEQNKVIREVNIPGRNPTNVAVDPAGKLGLVVTEAEKGQLISLPWIKPGAGIFNGGKL